MLFHGYNDEAPDAMNVGHIVRYNISMNDGDTLFHFYGSGQTGSVIYNNLFYNENPNVVPIIVDGNPSDVQLFNNIFHIPEMAEWIGVDSFDQLSFFGNYLLNKHIPENHTTHEMMRSDLHQLLNQSGTPDEQDEAIHQETIRKVWNEILSNLKL